MPGSTYPEATHQTLSFLRKLSPCSGSAPQFQRNPELTVQVQKRERLEVAHIWPATTKRNIQANGFSLVEALVSSMVLMTVTSQSLTLMTDSMQAYSKARLRDALYAAVHNDLEEVRHELSSWAAGQSNDGQLIYNPTSDSCSDHTLGSDLIEDKLANNKLIDGNIDLSNIPISNRGISINRTISTIENSTSAPASENIIIVNYSSQAGSLIPIKQKAYLPVPAQGWCP